MNRPEIIGYSKDGPTDQWGAKLQSQSEGAALEPQAHQARCAVAPGFGVRQPRRRQELYDYMHALAAARREKGDAESRHMSDTAAYYEERDEIAEALGIDVGAEDWWDSNDQTKREKIMGRISVLRSLRSVSTPNNASQQRAE